MKVFVASGARQGDRDSDFCWTVTGELVEVGFECAVDADDPAGVDGGCGCRRAMVGLSSRRATTTFTVADIEMSVREYVDALGESYRRRLGEPLARPQVAREARWLLHEASRFSVGAVLERRGDGISERPIFVD